MLSKPSRIAERDIWVGRKSLQLHALFVGVVHLFSQFGDALIDSDDQSDFLKGLEIVSIKTCYEYDQKGLSYVSSVAGGVSPQPDHVAGDAQHRGQGGEPTESVRPQRIRIAEVLDGGPLYDVENEDALFWWILVYFERETYRLLINAVKSC